MAPLDCHRAGHCLQLGSFLPEEKSSDLGSCGGCRDSPVSWRVPRGTLGLFPCSRGITVALDTGCPCGPARRALLPQEGKGTTSWLAGKESSQESPHPAQDRQEIPIHSSGSTPARAPRAGQSQKNPGQIQGYKPALSSSWEINPGQDSDPWGTEVQGHLGLN